VYEDSRQEYAEAERIAGACRERALGNLVPGDHRDAFTVFNSASWRRSGLVRLPLPGFRGSVRDRDGRALPIQCTEEQVLVQVDDIPPFAGMLVVTAPDEAPAAPGPFRIADQRLETPFYVLEWNGEGHVSRLFDRRAGREVLAGNEAANVLQVFEDIPRQYDAWELEASFEQKRETVGDLLGSTVESDGPLQVVIRFRWQYRNSRIDQAMVLYRDSPRIDFRTGIDWREREKLVKVAFPVRVRATEATYDIQFGNVKRPTHRNTSWDHARFEVVGHQWADLSEEGYGVALLNDCKYGYDVHDHVMRLTLLKSSNYPDPQADAGRHQFTYSLLPHAGSWQQAGVSRHAWDLNSPLHAVPGRIADGIDGRSLLRCDNPNVAIDAVKKAEDSDQLVVRLHEYAGSRGPVCLRSDFRMVSWEPCNLLEAPTGPEHRTDEISDSISPYQIKTWRVVLRS
jgi:alpha-mannosidase